MKKEYVISKEGNGRFNEKVAVVTGGTGAIGGAIAWRLGIEGATVFIAGRNTIKNKQCSEPNEKSKYRSYAISSGCWK